MFHSWFHLQDKGNGLGDKFCFGRKYKKVLASG